MNDDAFTITIVIAREDTIKLSISLKAIGIENIHIDEIKGKRICGRCGGSGNQLKSMYQKCVVCKGSGLVSK